MTTRLQLGEKRSFVYEKEKGRDPARDADADRGEAWDFVALDPDSRLVLGVVAGKRVGETAVALLEEAKPRRGGRTPELVASDEWPAYPEAIREVFGREATPEPTGRPGRPAGPRVEVPAGLTYATAHETRVKGRVVGVATRPVVGLWAALTALPGGSRVSTPYAERRNATGRHRDARKGRETYRFSKASEAHEAMTHFTMHGYDFCWPVRTLRQEVGPRRYRGRTPAMAAGPADNVRSPQEWLAFPACQP